jgi:succinyl-CoA synthetase beta subunit
MEDTSESDQREVEATRAGLNYIGLQGNIGCLGKSNKILFFFIYSLF